MRFFLTAVMSACALLPAVPSAAGTSPSVPSLEIRAARTSSGVLTIDRQTHVDSVIFPKTTPYAALVISHGAHVTFGYYRDDALDEEFFFGDVRRIIPAGTYRLTVVTPKATRAAVTLRGVSGSHVLRLRRAESASRKQVDLSLPTVPVHLLAATMQITHTTVALVAFDVSASANVAAYTSLCLTRAPICEAGVDTVRAARISASPGIGQQRATQLLCVYPGQLSTGAYSARVETAEAGLPIRGVLTAVGVDLPQ